MQIDSLRASSINTYKDCQFKYYLQQVIGFESKAGRKALIGTAFHHVQEFLARAKRNGHYRLNDKFTNLDFLTDICYNHYNKKEPGLFQDGDRDIIRSYCDLAWESNYNPLKLNILDIEKQFDIGIAEPGFRTFENKNMRLRGTIDLITIDDPDTLHIIDWKTGRRTDWVEGYLKDEETLPLDTQFQVYNLARKVIYPQYKYCLFTVIYISEGGPFSFTFEEADIPGQLENIRRVFAEIRANEDPQRLIDDKSRSKEFFKCKYVCQFGDRKDMRQSACQKYYKLFCSYKENELYQLKIDESCGKISRRNDYDQPGIFKGTFKL